MKTLSITTLIFLLVLGNNINATAQDDYSIKPTYKESYGNELNLGIGLGYYGYSNRTLPVLHIDYEFDVARNFTLAPFINFYSYQSNYYWGDAHNQYRYYTYTESVIPIGVKGSYYFDQLLNLDRRWDVYLAGSLGIVLRTTSWETGYNGQASINDGLGMIYLDLHIGAEYHMTKKLGLFVDLSTGVSTIGLGIHI